MHRCGGVRRGGDKRDHQKEKRQTLLLLFMRRMCIKRQLSQKQLNSILYIFVWEGIRALPKHYAFLIVASKINRKAYNVSAVQQQG